MSQGHTPPRRQSAGDRRRRSTDPREAGPVKASIRLSAGAYERLAIHAAKGRSSKSAVVEELINEHLRRYVVSDRGREEPGEGPRLADAA